MSANLHNIIIDTDVGLDDAATVAFAVAAPNTKIHAISTVFGNVSMTQSALNVYAIMQLYGQYDVKIFPGADRAMAYTYSPQWAGHGVRGLGRWAKPEHDVFAAIKYYKLLHQNNSNSAEYPHSYPHESPLSLEGKLVGLDSIDKCSSKTLKELFEFETGLGAKIPSSLDNYHNIVLTPPPTYPQDEYDSPRYLAAKHLCTMVNQKPFFYELICLGPLTNIALCLELEPSFLSKLKAFVWMGGGFSGNITPHAEFNAYSDSLAAKIVFEALSKVKTCGIDGSELPQIQQNNVVNDGNENNNVNNQHREQNEHVLRACGISWDATISAPLNLEEFQHIFQHSNKFSWDSILEDCQKNNSNKIIQNEKKTEHFDKNVDQNVSLSALHPNMKFLTAYVVRQFCSNYEYLIQQAHQNQQESLQQTYAHKNSYCNSGQDDDDDEHPINSKIHETTKDGDCELVTGLNPLQHDEEHEKKAEPLRIVICDIHALFALLYPETIKHSIVDVYQFKSQIGAEDHGKMIRIGQDDDVINAKERRYTFQFADVMDKDKFVNILRQFALSVEEGL
jgi:inosine-uridine nucleoside N-ribohydrolase